MEDDTPQAKQTRPTRLVIVDDHALLRDGLRSIIDQEPGFEVVGEAADGRQAIELCRRLRPDLVLMDVRMPDIDGLEATREIKLEHPSISVLIVTMHENPDYLLEALNAGAAGYVLKGAPGDHLIDAIERTMRGESPLNQELAALLLRRLANEGVQKTQPTAKPRKRLEPPAERLTSREYEVLRLLAQGQSNSEIAQNLAISKATAKVHVERILRKLGVSDRTQAAVRAIELGLAKDEPNPWPGTEMS